MCVCRRTPHTHTHTLNAADRWRDNGQVESLFRQVRKVRELCLFCCLLKRLAGYIEIDCVCVCVELIDRRLLKAWRWDQFMAVETDVGAGRNRCRVFDQQQQQVIDKFFLQLSSLL